jgi:hypothetical protein
MSDLKLLAEAVAGWGNCTEAWLDTSEDDAAAVVGHIDEDGNTYPVMAINCEQYYADHDSMKLAKFYAAANPNAVLQLVTLIEAQAAQIDVMQDALKEVQMVAESSVKTHGYDKHHVRNSDVAKRALATTHNDALQAFAEKVREQCAQVCDSMYENGFSLKQCANVIRAIKELPK